MLGIIIGIIGATIVVAIAYSVIGAILALLPSIVVKIIDIIIFGIIIIVAIKIIIWIIQFIKGLYEDYGPFGGTLILLFIFGMLAFIGLFLAWVGGWI